MIWGPPLCPRRPPQPPLNPHFFSRTLFLCLPPPPVRGALTRSAARRTQSAVSEKWRGGKKKKKKKGPASWKSECEPSGAQPQRPQTARSGRGRSEPVAPKQRLLGAGEVGSGGGDGGRGGERGAPLPSSPPSPSPPPLLYIFFSPPKFSCLAIPPWIRRRLAIGCWGRVRQSDCDVQSSCFLQLCLKVNLVVERSPQPRERSEIIHHCSRGKQSGAKELSPGPPAPSPLRSSPLLSPLFSSLLTSRLFSCALSAPLPTLPLPTLSSLPSPSPRRPARACPHGLTVPCPIIIFITRKISPRACARACPPLSACPPPPKKRLGGSHCSLHRVSIFSPPSRVPSPFPESLVPACSWMRRPEKETPITQTRVHIYPPHPHPREKRVFFRWIII